MNPLIGYLGEKLSFKLNFNSIDLQRCEFKLEEPDRNYCQIEFTNENGRNQCLMTSAKLDNEFKSEIKLFYEIKLNSIAITYYPSLAGYYELNVKSNGKQLDYKILIKDQTKDKFSSLNNSSFQSLENTIFIEINLNKECNRFNAKIQEYLDKSALDKSIELNNLKSLNRVTSELAKLIDKYKISTINSFNSTMKHSNLSISNLSTISSSTPKRSYLTIRTDSKSFSKRTIVDPMQSNESSNQDCTSNSFIAKFFNNNNLDLNNNLTPISSLNQSIKLNKKQINYNQNFYSIEQLLVQPIDQQVNSIDQLLVNPAKPFNHQIEFERECLNSTESNESLLMTIKKSI